MTTNPENRLRLTRAIPIEPLDSPLLKRLIHNLPDLVWLKTPDGAYMACNARFEAFFGRTEGEIIGRSDADFVDAELAALFRANDLAAIAAGGPRINEEIVTYASDGHREHLQTIKTPMFAEDGSLIGVLGVARDISDIVRIQAELRESRDRLTEAERLAKLGSWSREPESGTPIWSDEVFRIFERDPRLQPPSYETLLELVHPDDRARVDQTYRAAMAQRQYFLITHRLQFPDGRIKHVQVRGEHLCAPDGKVLRTQGTIQDITDRVEAELALVERAGIFAAIADQAVDSIALVDPQTGRFVEFNDAAARNLGYDRATFATLSVADIEAFAEPERILTTLQRMCAPAGMTIESTHRTRDGRLRDVRISARSIQIKGQTFLASIWSDVTERNRARAEIERLSTLDPLTGLLNRSLILDRAGQALAAAHRDPRHAALLICDLDRFKAFNDLHGHAIGDQLLQEIARRLSKTLDASLTLARISADEFAVLIPDAGRREEHAMRSAIQTANAMLDAIRTPFSIDGNDIRPSCSVGITLFPRNRDDTLSTILQRTDSALQQAKVSGGNQCAFYDAAVSDFTRQRLQIERELHQALAQQQLRLYIQGQYTPGGKLVSAEALVRWQHPERGLIAPGVFVPVAEESELIIELDRWVLRETCRLQTSLQQQGLNMAISVNISPRHFGQRDFVDAVRQTLALSGCDPTTLVLEVTEGLLLDNVDDVIRKMADLSRLGVRFSIDDFGTGYSSLAYLKRLPIHELKIDRTFVQDIGKDGTNHVLVDTIISIARHMKLKIVAEGVELAEQAAYLASLDEEACILCQGFHFARPRPVEGWLADLTAPSAKPC
ncbi:sensor domain-containing protein [Parazoarcus communis]|uniref:GGDEF domain-containing protein n=2 Tax=root TaxID=1 RepID=A0A323US77_9RHOO|nr:EAL domain-containing protein [Parazoarcus communis]NMG72088.1 EAL domain-containing protein [Parazoarcus communis SWub3 = DSM 12120]PZA14530.1 GGDEF domain-containing protein [Azoarcus communis] [Parazoarcus communis SWub3 = DSM 12120]